MSQKGTVPFWDTLLYLLTTAVAVIMALGVAHLINPGMGLDMTAIQTSGAAATAAEPTSITDTLLNIIPANVFTALANGTMLQIIFFVLILGVILGQLGQQVDVVKRFFDQFNAIMMKMVDFVLKVAPIGVFCLIARTFANLGFEAVVPVFKFVGGTYVGLILQLCVVYMVLLFLFTRLNPLRFLRKMLPVLAFGIDLGAAGYLTVILTATLASIGTAGVPGVGTIMLAMVFGAVGLPAEGISMIMGVDRLVDMGRTAINVTGDAVVTTIVAKLNGTLDRTVFDADQPPLPVLGEEDLMEEAV